MARWPTRREVPRRAALLLALVLPLLGASGDEPSLRFAFRGETVGTRGLTALSAIREPALVRVFEPYEARELTLRAFELRAVLDAVYGERWRREEELLFTCSDGYQPSVPVQRFLDYRAWLAFARSDRPEFDLDKQESGTTKRIPAGPFYVVWENLDEPRLRQDGDFGWPYQVVGVDVIRAAERFPKLTPPADASPAVRAGFVEFRIHCSRCHKLNGEGGDIGPELNPPHAPIETLPRDFLRQWIDDPHRIAPNARMERLNPGLPDRARVIDEILAYLEAMAAAGRPAEPAAGG